MKKLILYFVVGLFVFSAATAIAYTPDNLAQEFNPETATKEEAIAYIEKSLSDPQIKQWVAERFVSEKIFLLGVKLAPEKTVKEVATSFSDFQKFGGHWSSEEWVKAIIAMAGLGVCIIILAMVLL